MFLDKAEDTSTRLMDDASQTAHQAIKSTQQAANEALETLSGALQDLRHKTVPMAEHAEARVAAFAQRGIDGVRDTSHQLRLKAEHASDNTVAYIKHDPIKSVLIAAATGAALMALISLISHNRSHK